MCSHEYTSGKENNQYVQFVHINEAERAANQSNTLIWSWDLGVIAASLSLNQLYRPSDVEMSAVLWIESSFLLAPLI